MRIGKKWISLNALHTFAAAGRHMHMRRAAEELNVTQSAVSHQVRSLEADLGVQLFSRQGRGLALTGDGQKLLQTVQQALNQIASTSLQLGGDAFSGELSIASPASITTQWLVPRLPGFLSTFPNLTLRRSTIPASPRTSLPDVDIAIVFDEHRYPGKRVSGLVELDLFPVCAPSYYAGPFPLQPAQLRTGTLIHEDDGRLWARWFAATGTEQFEPRRHVYAATTHDATELARSGVGFAINDKFMGSLLLERGELIRPFGAAILKYGQYYLLTSPLEQMSEPALEFERWIKQEVG